MGEPGELPRLARAAAVPQAEVTGEPGEPPGIGGAAIDPLADATGAAGEFPGEDKRPCYRVYDDWCGPDRGPEDLRAVADFIARHGDSRFSVKGDTGAIVRERAGWWTDTVDGRVYLFTAAGLREATQGHDFGRAASR